MRRVFIASPYAGNIARNERYARACMADSLGRGEAPFVPHLLYTQVLPEDGGAGRQRGLDAALAQLAGQDLLAVYGDLGVSSGMAGEIERAAKLGVPAERRRIGWVDKPPRCSECYGSGVVIRGSMLHGEAWEDPCPRCWGTGEMPVNDKIRHDPATLLWMADMLSASAGMEARDAEERGAVKALGIIADGLCERAAAEAASLPPRLSDWLRACEDSKLGVPPEWHTVREGILAAWPPHAFALVTTSRWDIPSQRSEPIQPYAQVERRFAGGDRAFTSYSDPAALREALDALADAKGD